MSIEDAHLNLQRAGPAPAQQSPWATHLRRTPLIALALAWLVLVAWRPFTFGFYHDDWWSVVAPTASTSLWELVSREPSRPLYIPVLHLLRAVLGPHAWAWQAALALVHFVIAWGVARAVDSLDDAAAGERASFPWPGFVAGVAWLAFPWSLGYSAWPVMLPPLLGMAAAIWSLVLLAGARRRSEFVASGALLVSGWMIYEATWFLWAPAVMVLLAVARKRGPVPKAFWLQVACVAGAQVVFVAANRLLASLSATSKKISGDILGTMGTNQHLFKEQLGRQFHDVWLPVAIALAVLAGTALVVALSRRVLPGLLLRVAACAIGIALAVLMYAAASYAIQWEGLFARTTLPISFWLALLAGLLVQAAERAGSSVVRWVGRGSALAACAVFALVLVRESAPWQESWQEQQAVVRSFPAELLRVADHRTVVLIDLPHGPAPVYGFGAYWDISGALSAMLPPERTNTPMPYAFATVLRESELRTGWDGHNVRQAWCSAPENALWQLPAERVFVWRYPGQEVLPVAPGFATGCKPLKQG